jgi:hypothetical protein
VILSESITELPFGDSATVEFEVDELDFPLQATAIMATNAKATMLSFERVFIVF